MKIYKTPKAVFYTETVEMLQASPMETGLDNDGQDIDFGVL